MSETKQYTSPRENVVAFLKRALKANFFAVPAVFLPYFVGASFQEATVATLVLLSTAIGWVLSNE